MAYNQSGQSYPGQYAQYHNSPEPQHPYGAHRPLNSNRQSGQRRPSFEAGDDTVPYHNSDAQSNNGNYEIGHIQMPNQEQFMPSAGAMTGGYSGGFSNGGGYQYHGSIRRSPPATYNPQQYARTDQRYNQPTYASPAPLVTNTPSMNYHPYNPAAYSATTTHSSSGFGRSSYDTLTPTYSSTSPRQTSSSHPPPVPPRPQEYMNRLSQSPGSQHHSSFAERVQRQSSSVSPSQTGSPTPSHPTTYTPPAPPPPPFSPNPNPDTSASQAPPPRSHPQGPTSSYSAAPFHSPAGPASSYQRLPSLSNYQGSGDYSTPTSEIGYSLSPEPSSHVSGSSSPAPPPPPHSPRRSDTSGRHPQSRPLPGPPPSSYEEAEHSSQVINNEGFGYDEILDEVEATVMGRTPVTAPLSGRSPRLERLSTEARIDNDAEPKPLFSGSGRTAISPDIRYSHTNGASASGAGIDVNYDAYSDDSDAEAAAGLAAMQMAEEQEAADLARRSHISSSIHSRTPSHQTLQQPPISHDIGSSSDSDVPVDMETYGGGLSASLGYHYGDETPQPNVVSHSEDYMFMNEESIHPFRAFGARTDTGGTGGLAEPSSQPRRLSFEDGDEATLVDGSIRNDSSSALSTEGNSVRSNTSYPSRTGSRPGSRPLPQIPGSAGSDLSVRRQTDQYGRLYYPQAPDEYDQTYSPNGSYVHKANSMGSHSHTPQIVPPGRSITDAEQRRRAHLNGLRASGIYDTLSPDAASVGSAKLGEITLPTLPAGKRRKFDAAKLSTNDFKRCSEPWAQSSILAWIKEMTEGESDLREQAIVTGITALFTHKVPTMNTADAEVLSAQLVEEMFSQGALLKEEEWVKFGTTPMSGVIFQLTGTGCYSPKVHLSTTPGRCYAHHCMRTLKKINLQTHVLAPQRKAEDWATFYKITKEKIEGIPKKDIERQNNLHEIVTSEDYFMDQLNVLRVLYRDGLAHSPQPIIPPKKLDGFLRDVFGKVDAVKQANEDYLLAQLKYRQEEQGPWIKGFSDIFREWIRRAKSAFTDYASSLPKATFLVRKEAERNVLFRQFLDQVRENERSRRLGWDTYLKAPITRLQRYGLLLQTVQKNMVVDSEEKTNLATAIEEIKVVTLECDARVADQSKRADLDDLSYKLKLRPGMEKVQLNLNHLGREIIHRGDLQRRGKATWLDIHVILFDHYMVLSKPIQQRDAAGGLKHEIYDVSKLPIPMDLLVLDSTNDDPVVKSTVKGITSVSTLSKQATSNSASGTGGPGTLIHSSTAASSVSNGSSARSLITTTVLDSPSERVIYPFRIKHLGKTEVYTLYAPSSQNRQEWCDKIIEAKTRHASSLFRQNAEPFRLRVLADTAFAYDSQSGGPRGVVIKGTPLDRAVEECQKSFYGTGPLPSPVCRAAVNCATTFNQPYGKRMVAVGTDYGVFLSENGNARAWTRAINASHVTQIAVLEDFSLFIIISDKSLIAYHLETVCPVGGPATATDSRKAPQKLSGNRDVGFFSVGRQKERTLVFYKKKDGISSTFKVLEPVYQKSATSTRSRFAIRRGGTDFFRDFDDFYIPSETYAINLFQSSLAISTARGIEILTLDKKVPISVPDLKTPEVASIAQRIHGQKPLGMFRLSDNEFLLVFEEVGIYVDKHGDVSRAVVMEFVGKAKQACLIGSMYLVLVDAGAGFVEVRNAVNGRLRQVISGRDVKLLDDGQPSGTVKICMQHPEEERNQVVLEMIVNEGLKE